MVFGEMKISAVLWFLVRHFLKPKIKETRTFDCLQMLGYHLEEVAFQVK